MSLYCCFYLFTFHRCEVLTAKHPALARTGIYPDWFLRQRFCQVRAERVCRVIVLTEYNTAVFQPCFGIGAVLGKEIANGGDLGIAGLWPRQFGNDSLQVFGFF